jgi:hypothetical protein
LLKAIERAPETTDHAIGNRVARRWLHVYLLSQLTVKKSILHIKLTDRPVTNRSNGKKSTNSGHVSHWSKGLVIVTAMLLLKAASDKSSLVALKRTIGASLDLVDPLAGDGTNRGRRSDNIPSASTLKSSNLLSHR